MYNNKHYMITTYLLQNCKHCKDILQYIQNNPNVNICLIIVSRDDIEYIKEQEPRIKQFPVAFMGNPKVNGMPYKNSTMLYGSQTILDTLISNFGNPKFGDSLKTKPINTKLLNKKYENYNKLTGNQIEIDYQNNNQGNTASLKNIRRHRNNCFGSSNYIMDRPYGPTDSLFILQGYQTPCANPIRSDLPIRNKVNFGTTPGTIKWKQEKLSRNYKQPKILVSSDNHNQRMLGNDHVHINVPRTYSKDYLNTKVYDPVKLANRYGKFVSGPVNDNAPFLTYGAGSNTRSHITGRNYLPEQIPIENQYKNAYMSGNLQNYLDQNISKQKLMSPGLSSQWSYNAQGTNHRIHTKENNYGKHYRSTNNNGMITSRKVNSSKRLSKSNPMILTQTTFDSSGGNSGIAQYFKRNMFPMNGNNKYGKNSLRPSNKLYKTKSNYGNNESTNKSSNKSTNQSYKKKQMKFTSPLGIEISFD